MLWPPFDSGEAVVSDLTAVAMSDSGLKIQHELASAWSGLIPSFPNDAIYVLPSIEHAVDTIHSLIEDARSNPSRHSEVKCEASILVTGSLHLVGGIMEVAGLSGIAL